MTTFTILRNNNLPNLIAHHRDAFLPSKPKARRVKALSECTTKQ
jgi:hypothetical protein